MLEASASTTAPTFPIIRRTCAAPISSSQFDVKLRAEAAPIKCAGRESAGLPALSHSFCMRKCR